VERDARLRLVEAPVDFDKVGNFFEFPATMNLCEQRLIRARAALSPLCTSSV
jgi:hypothetical protein